MALIQKFPTAYPPHQWRIRQEIARLAEKSGEIDPASYPYEKCDPEFTGWNDQELQKLLHMLQDMYLEKQYAEVCKHKVPLSKNEEPAIWRKIKRDTLILFPLKSEVETRRRSEEQAYKTAKEAVRKTGRPARSQAGDNEATRKKMIAKVHIAKNDLQKRLPEFNDDTYRFILQTTFDASSSKDLSISQLHELLLHFQDIGWRQKASGKRGNNVHHPLLTHDPAGLGRTAQMKKIQALLLEKGNVEGRAVSFNYALAILKRQTRGKVESFEDATPTHLRGVITALTQDAARKGRRVK